MTLSTEENKIIYSPDGVATVFTYNFRVDNASDMQVYVDEQQYASGWSMDGLGDPAGGNVIFDTAPSGTTVTLLRIVPETQETDYTPYDPFPAETHELALDKLTMEVQQLSEQFTRVAIAPIGGTGDADNSFPPYDAGKVIGWDTSEVKLVNYAQGEGGGSSIGDIDLSGQGPIIDLSTSQYFGDMTEAAGLAGCFDGSLATAGQVSAVTGYCGADISAVPRVIYGATFNSPVNGFDASGGGGDVSLSLYGRNGSLPSNGTDGTLLSILEGFQDVNTVSAVLLRSNDIVTQWDYVWGYLETDTWCTVTELELYEYEEPTSAETEGAIVTTNRTFFSVSANSAVTIKTGPVAEIPQFRIRFESKATANARISAFVTVRHNGDFTGYTDIVSCAMALYQRSGATESALDSASWSRIGNFVFSGTLLNLTQLYLTTILETAIPIGVGFHEFTLYFNANSSGTALNDLARIYISSGAGANKFVIDVDPGASLVEF